ncbi:MAG: DNA-3-methyladenine glycosylase [Lachnospiraceae bacterium]|nr:DNA-3-methyladenine glycosylase [Lachnospiraceae bacterium]
MRLSEEFYHRDCLEVAPELVGKVLVRTLEDGSQLRLRISETEAYRGQEDTACHAHKGRTRRTEVLYHEAGRIYVYLCYGIHWLLNIVTGEKEVPQAVLIRACMDAEGPGKLTKYLKVNGTFNDTSILTQKALWVEDDGMRYEILTDTRVGIGYASEEDQNRLWRFKMGQEQNSGLTNQR